MHRTTKLCIIVVVVVIIIIFIIIIIIIIIVIIIIIIISYCLTFVCLLFSSTEFICALGGERKKPMCAICTTPSLRSFLNVAFKTVSPFVSLFRLFKEGCRAETSPFPERTEKGSSFRFPFNRMLTVNKR